MPGFDCCEGRRAAAALCTSTPPPPGRRPPLPPAVDGRCRRGPGPVSRRCFSKCRQDQRSGSRAASGPAWRPAQGHRRRLNFGYADLLASDALQPSLPARPPAQHWLHPCTSTAGVKDQPWGDAETLQGARNRAVSIQALHPRSVLVAIEGGVGPATPLPPPTLQPGQQRGAAGPAAGCQVLECFAWVVVQAPCGATAHARSASFPLPPAVSRLMLEEELELGAADDRVFKR